MEPVVLEASIGAEALDAASVVEEL